MFNNTVLVSFKLDRLRIYYVFAFFVFCYIANRWSRYNMLAFLVLCGNFALA